MGDFGDKFRKAREKRELSLDDVSNVTKINARMLRAIEQEHFDDLPGGVFNKGFIRAYAKHLGLDAEEAITDYLASLRQAQIDAQEAWEPPHAAPTRPSGNGGTAKPEPKNADPKPSPSPVAPVHVEELPELQLPRAEHVRGGQKEFMRQPSGAVPWRIVAAAALVLALGLFLWVRHTRSLRATAVAPVKAAVAAAISLPATQPPVTRAAAVIGNPSSPVPASSAPAASQLPPQASPKSLAATVETTSPAPAHPPEESSDVTVKKFGKSTPKPAEKSAAPLALVIRAAENSWISVFSDGQLVTQETLIAPAHTSVRGSREITVRVGNAAGVSFIWNGQEISAQGSEAEVKDYTFDSGGMHVSTTAPGPGTP